MAHIQVSFSSKALKMPVEAELLVPEGEHTKYKVLILLHTEYQDRMEWLLKSSIATLLEGKPILVFMPSGKGSFFVNTANGYHYMDYISKEIPEFIKAHFSVSEHREDWMLVGAGMGGYGALFNGLHQKEQFGNIASLGGVLDIFEDDHFPDGISREIIFGDIMKRRYYDLYTYVKENPELPQTRIFLACGQQDLWVKSNEQFIEKAKEFGPVAYHALEGGHSFLCWNTVLPQMIEWFKEGWL